MKQINGGVTAAKGYEAASTAAGIKYQGRTDMALIYSQVPCVSAGTFTTNVVKAAPVKWDRQIVDSGAGVQAVVVNSGIANACTGEEGMGYCKETAEAAAKAHPDHALFIGFAPSDSPEVAFATRIANGYSSTYAAEVARDVMKYYYQLTPENELITGTASSIGSNASNEG